METELPAPSRTPSAIRFFCASSRPQLGVEQHGNAYRVQRPGQEHGPTLSSRWSRPPPTSAAPRNRRDCEVEAE